MHTSVSQWVSQWVSQSVNESVSESVSQPASQSVSQSCSSSIYALRTFRSRVLSQHALFEVTNATTEVRVSSMVRESDPNRFESFVRHPKRCGFLSDASPPLGIWRLVLTLFTIGVYNKESCFVPRCLPAQACGVRSSNIDCVPDLVHLFSVTETARTSSPV